jgi:ATP-dependent Lhr-like helicase
MEKALKVEVESPMPTREDAELAERLYADSTLVARLRRLRELVMKHARVLVFVNTRETAEMLGSRLRLLDEGLPVAVHHGSLARDVRIDAERKFRDGLAKALICTSSMELGIDIGAVDLVIQYMSPRQVVRLVQRVGRSGHRAGELSKGHVIATSPDDIVEASVIARKAMAGELESGKMHELALDVLAHQLAGICVDKGGVTAADAMRILKRAYPFRNLGRGDLNSVVEQLKSEGIMLERDGRLKLRKAGLEYYFTNISMIPDSKRYQIQDIVSRKPVAALDEEFVASYAEPGVTFICKGETWRAVDIDHERAIITVEKAEDPVGAIPAWEGELIPVPFDVAQEVGAVRKEVELELKKGHDKEEVVKALAQRYPSSHEAAGWFVDEIVDSVQTGAQVPSRELVIIESSGDFVVVHSCFGNLVNNTLGWTLGTVLSARLGSSVAVKVDPYRIALRFPENAKPEWVEEVLRTTSPDYLTSVLDLTLKNSSMFQWRLVHVAKRFGAIMRDADLSGISLRRLVRTFEDTPIYAETLRETTLEKLDVARTKEILDEIRSGKIKLMQMSREEGPSPLAWTILDELSSGELVTPKRAEREIMAVVRSRLEEHWVRLHCMNCNSWTAHTKVKRLSDPVKCGKCGARLVTVLPFEYKRALAAIQKKAAGKKLTGEEKKIVEQASQTANLVLTYGKSAAVVLAGRGIGPRVATRILAKRRTGDELYKEILRAEKTYARTRRFWK